MSDFYKVTSQKENIYRITSHEGVYCELLVGTEKALLIDTSFGTDDLKGVVEKLTNGKPLIIVNTHGHLDHACGNAQFDQDVFISEMDYEVCKTHTKGNTGSIKPLNDGDIFDLGGITVRAIAAPGHTAGSIAFLYEEENWLYVGDATNAYCWLWLEESCGREVYTTTLDKLIALKPTKVFGSHMAEPVDTDRLRLYKRAAVEADYTKGLPFQSPFPSPPDTRVCIIDGLTMEDMGKPGFASVVVREDFWRTYG